MLECCPNCYDEDYSIEDYGDEFDQDGGEQWWVCACTKCDCRFTIHRFYTLEETIVEKIGKGE